MQILDFIGLVLPFFIDFINRYVKQSWAKLWISFAVALVVAGVINASYLLDNPAMVLEKGAFLFAQAHLVYKTLYERSALRAKVHKL